MTTWEPLLLDVMRESSHRLVAYAGLYTGNLSDAEDVVQEALIKVFSRNRSFINAASAEVYVRRAIPSVFIDRARASSSRRRAHVRSVDRAPHVVDIDAQVDVRRALHALPPRERTCIVLRFFDDLPVAEIAHRLYISEGAVKRYLSDASKRLSELLAVDVEWTRPPRSVPVVPRGTLSSMKEKS